MKNPECTCFAANEHHSRSCAISIEQRQTADVVVPRKEWREIMKELRDFRADHAEMQSKLAKILGALSEYATIEKPLNHSKDT
jgi:DNA polymerase III sliding clamp (beta) subunit (PCNA family)